MTVYIGSTHAKHLRISFKVSKFGRLDPGQGPFTFDLIVPLTSLSIIMTDMGTFQSSIQESSIHDDVFVVAASV